MKKLYKYILLNYGKSYKEKALLSRLHQVTLGSGEVGAQRRPPESILDL